MQRCRSTREHRMHDTKDPIDILVQEHETDSVHLERLAQAANHIRREGFSHEAFAEISEAVIHLCSGIYVHHEREEKYLYPLLDRHANVLLQELRREHRDFAHGLNRVVVSVEDIEEGRIHSETICELVEASDMLVKLFTRHVTKETLFPLAKKVLTKEEYVQLQEEMNQSRTSLDHHS